MPTTSRPLEMLEVHAVNYAQTAEYIRLLEEHGATWESLRPQSQAEPAARIFYPEGTTVEQDPVWGTATARRYIITFPDGFFMYWYKTRWMGAAVHAINIPKQD